MDTKKPSERSVVWQERFNIAKANQEKMFKRFASWYDLMYATVTNQNIAPWRSKVFIPIMASKGWNMIAKMVGLKPGFDVTVRDDMDNAEELHDKARKASLKLSYDYENPMFDEPMRDKLLAPLVDAVVTGTGFAKVPWCVEKSVRFERMINQDGTVDLTKQKRISRVDGYNDLIPVNIFNLFVAPTASNLYDAPWIIIKEYKTLDELKEHASDNGKDTYRNLDKLVESRQESDEFATYKKSRNRLTTQDDKISADTTLDHIAVYECYEDDMIYTYASGGSKDKKENWIEIRAQKNYYWHGKYPLVKFCMKQRPYEFWGEGIFETTERLQSAVNDVFNHYMDNYNLSVDGMLMIEANSDTSDYVVEPGGEIVYRGQKPEQFKFPEPNPGQLQAVTAFIEKAIEDVTISPYSTGAPNSATDKTGGTATGILRLQQAAGDLLSFFRANFQQSIHQIGEMWLSNNQQFMDRNVTIETPDNANSESVTVSPADMQGDLAIHITDSSMEPLTKDEKKQARIAFTQQALALQQASFQQYQLTGIPPLTLQYSQLLSDLARDFDENTVDTLVVPEEEAQAIMQQHQQMMAQAAQPQQDPQKPEPPSVKKIADNIKFNELPEDARQALLEGIGLPSGSPTPAAQDQAAKLFSDASQLHGYMQTALSPDPPQNTGVAQ